MDALFEDFVAYLRYERAYSELTLVSYSSSLKAFELYFKSLDEEMSWETVTSDVTVFHVRSSSKDLQYSSNAFKLPL